jgi:hypothetical protein
VREMAFYKNQGPILVGLLCALIVILSNFIAFPGLDTIAADVKNFASIIAGFALFLGLIGIVRLHSDNIIERSKHWPLSVALIAVLVVFLAVGITYGQGSPEFNWIYDTIYGPLTATTYSLLSFWVCSAAYRAFKPRSIESLILVITGLLVFFGVTPLSAYISPFFPAANNFISSVLNVAGVRGMNIGIGIGIISFGLQIITGMERSWMGGD